MMLHQLIATIDTHQRLFTLPATSSLDLHGPYVSPTQTMKVSL